MSSKQSFLSKRAKRELSFIFALRFHIFWCSCEEVSMFSETESKVFLSLHICQNVINENLVLSCGFPFIAAGEWHCPNVFVDKSSSLPVPRHEKRLLLQCHQTIFHFYLCMQATKTHVLLTGSEYGYQLHMSKGTIRW